VIFASADELEQLGFKAASGRFKTHQSYSWKSGHVKISLRAMQMDNKSKKAVADAFKGDVKVKGWIKTSSDRLVDLQPAKVLGSRMMNLKIRYIKNHHHFGVGHKMAHDGARNKSKKQEESIDRSDRARAVRISNGIVFKRSMKKSGLQLEQKLMIKFGGGKKVPLTALSMTGLDASTLEAIRNVLGERSA